jgi:hypothetical protein
MRPAGRERPAAVGELGAVALSARADAVKRGKRVAPDELGLIRAVAQRRQPAARELGVWPGGGIRAGDQDGVTDAPAAQLGAADSEPPRPFRMSRCARPGCSLLAKPVVCWCSLEARSLSSWTNTSSSRHATRGETPAAPLRSGRLHRPGPHVCSRRRPSVWMERRQRGDTVAAILRLTIEQPHFRVHESRSRPWQPEQ